jgi:hypothetical protein
MKRATAPHLDMAGLGKYVSQVVHLGQKDSLCGSKLSAGSPPPFKPCADREYWPEGGENRHERREHQGHDTTGKNRQHDSRHGNRFRDRSFGANAGCPQRDHLGGWFAAGRAVERDRPAAGAKTRHHRHWRVRLDLSHHQAGGSRPDDLIGRQLRGSGNRVPLDRRSIASAVVDQRCTVRRDTEVSQREGGIIERHIGGNRPAGTETSLNRNRHSSPDAANNGERPGGGGRVLDGGRCGSGVDD